VPDESAPTSSPRNVTELLLTAPLPRSYLDYFGRKILVLIETLHGLTAFALITLGVAISNFGSKRHVIRPLVRSQVFRSGIRLLPMVGFMSVALGIIIVAQTEYILNRVGAENLVGTVMVSVVVRELGPILAALIVMARVGAATVIELGTARAMGEVEALEAIGIDPIHYLVVPRVFGLAISIFSLTVYSIFIALASGYLFAFLEDVPLEPLVYINQLAESMRWEDFVLIGLKTFGFGAIIALIICYHGLARPLGVTDVSMATTHAVAHSVIGVVLLDFLIIAIYLLIFVLT
jgi:phospholipid/cholesterol/gamma-HCH transport system permease protein